MSEVEKIVCKPTRWFLIRAVVMLLMFGVFAVLFFMDGSTGYRKKNEVYYLHEAFKTANEEFAKRDQEVRLTPETWRQFAAQQTVALPADPSVLPSGMTKPMPWPEILHDYNRMKPLQWNNLWREYTKSRGMNEEAPEEPYDSRKIQEQWVVFWISVALALLAAFFLVRTLRRSISADADAVTDQRGRRVPYSDLKVLDLRKWDTKGLGFIDFDGASGKGRLRIDGLTYGGFKAEDGEAAEQLMQFIRARFSGEVIEYAPVGPDEAPAPEGDSSPKTE
jgi:hypothetical protein